MADKMERLVAAVEEANRRRDGAYPWHQAVLDTLNLGKKTLWRGKPKMRLRARLIIELQAIIAALEYAAESGEPVEDQLRHERAVLKLIVGSNTPKSLLGQIDLFLDVALPGTNHSPSVKAKPDATPAIFGVRQ